MYLSQLRYVLARVEIAILVAAIIGGWALVLRRVGRRALPAPTYLDTDADIALTVARHEARTRQQHLGPLHLLYGLLQDERIVAALERLGRDPRACEHATLDALDAKAPGRADIATAVLRYAIGIARGHDRLATCVDLWAAIAKAKVSCADVDPLDVLFVLVHGEPEPKPAGAAVVELVLHDDDYTTRDLVVTVLREVIELDEARATALMQQTHDQGRARIGQRPATLAAAANRRAREAGSPLWIEVVR